MLLLACAGCGPGYNPVQVSPQDAAVFELGPLPISSKRSSALDPVPGAQTDPLYPGVGGTVQGSHLALTATGPVAWALYSYAMPAGHGLGNLHVEAAGEFYVALSNYATGRWQWAGPFSGQADLAPDAGSLSYTSPSGNFYWAVATASGKSAQVVQSVVNHAGQKFFLPPAGEATLESATVTQPSMLQMPAGVATAAVGAPLIAYLDTSATTPGLGHQLKLAYFDGAAWQTQPVAGGRLLCNPQIAFSRNRGYIVAGDTVAKQTIAFTFDWEWQATGEELVADWPGGDQPVQYDIAVSPVDGSLGFIHGYKGNQVLYSIRTASGWSTDPAFPMNPGDGALGVSCAFAPDGTAWATYAHGVFVSASLSLASTLEVGARTDGAWAFTPQALTALDELGNPKPTNPVVVDLHVSGSGTPELVLSSSRLASVNIPFVGEYTPPTLTDVHFGTYDGSDWSYTQLFTSTFDSSLNIILFNLTMDLDMAPICGWAGPNALWFNRVQGDVTIHFNLGGEPLYSFVDPDVPSSAHYYTRNGATFEPSAAFTGQNGTSFSFGMDIPQPASAAYIGTSTVNVERIIESGQPSATGDLVYWRE